MKKSRTIKNFIGILVICVILFIFAVVKFPLPASDNDYVGFLRAIPLGIEYKGGTTYNYDVLCNTTENSNSAEGIEAHALRIENLLQSSNFDAKVYSSANTIRVDIFDEYDAGDIAYLLNTDYSLSFKTEESLTAETKMSGTDIKNATGTSNNGTYGVYLEFTATGRTLFKELTSSVISASSSGGNVYIYIGESLFTPITVKEAIDQEGVFISGSMTNLKTAELYAAKINASRFDYEFSLNAKQVISQNQALVSLISSGILIITILILGFAWLIIKYKKLGLYISLGVLVTLLSQIILLQAVPVVLLTAPALIGSLLTFVFGILGTTFMLNKMNSEYSLGKKLFASVKFGYKKSFATMLDVFLVLLLASVVFYIFASSMARYFLISFIIGLVCYGLDVVVINLWFSRWYLNINSSKAELCGFKREEGVNELA